MYKIYFSLIGFSEGTKFIDMWIDGFDTKTKKERLD